MAHITVQPPVKAGAALTGSGVSIEIEGVVKRYRTMTAVDHVSLIVEPGEFLTLLGSSGSGKSTLLNIIAGLDHDFEGKITLGGADTQVGFIFQSPRLLPWSTGQTR